MRIVHIAESLGGGLLEFVVKIVRYLPLDYHIIVFGKVIEGGWDRSLVLEDMRKKFPANVEFYHWEAVQREINPLSDFKSLWTLQNIISQLERVDVFHLHSSKAGAIGRALFFLTRRKEPVFYTPNGAPFLRLDLSTAKRALVSRVEKVANHMSGKIVCCSKSEFEVYQAKGITPYIFINNGTEISDLEPIRRVGERENSRKIRICSVGRLTFQKNPALFNLIASAFAQNSALEFVWIGEGELREAIKSPNIRVTGWLTKEQVKQEVIQSDIYLSTALWEGLPFAVLEAMSWGKPLLLKSAVGNVDLVKDNENGALFHEAADAIKVLQDWINNPTEIEEKGKVSFQFCQTSFNAAVNFPAFRELYVKAINDVKK